MSNPSKQKGTGGETELLRDLNMLGFTFRRTPPGTLWDLEQDGILPTIDVLATRPDRGRWLFTMPRTIFVTPFEPGRHIRIEVKRHARFALHGIFESKFGRRP